MSYDITFLSRRVLLGSQNVLFIHGVCEGLFFELSGSSNGHSIDTQIGDYIIDTGDIKRIDQIITSPSEIYIPADLDNIGFDVDGIELNCKPSIDGMNGSESLIRQNEATVLKDNDDDYFWFHPPFENIKYSNFITNDNTDLDGWIIGTDGASSLSKSFSSLFLKTDGTESVSHQPIFEIPGNALYTGNTYRMMFTYKVISGSPILSGFLTSTSTYLPVNETLTGSGTSSHDVLMIGDYPSKFLFNGSNDPWEIEIREVTVVDIGTAAPYIPKQVKFSMIEENLKDYIFSNKLPDNTMQQFLFYSDPVSDIYKGKIGSCYSKSFDNVPSLDFTTKYNSEYIPII